MTFVLSSQNVADYLSELGFASHGGAVQPQVKQILAKNFNLLLNWPEGHHLLVKQESYDRNGKIVGEFLREWRIREFLRHFPDLRDFNQWIPEILHFDPESLILISTYLVDYQDLMAFYLREKIFPELIASTLGVILANIHRQTLDRQDYRDFFQQKSVNTGLPDQVTSLIHGLERVTPEVFAEVPTEGLKFFALYQRYDSLGKAIAELSVAFEPCCLTHNDLKLNNILLADDWENGDSDPSTSQKNIQIIDWERSGWGDPAFDLGLLIASYLQLWLQSLIASNTIAIEESLRLAITPLEILQPSLSTLMIAYLEHFPKILERRPDFLRRVMQFSGLALIQSIQAMIQHQKSFGNTGICMLQVAKTLLCRPEDSVSTILGVEVLKFAQPYCATPSVI
jgi:5-methylthioribose kinase